MKEGIRWCPHCREPHPLASRFCSTTGKKLDSQLNEASSIVVAKHPLTGTVLEREYEILNRIGKGGMNEVFEARHRETKQLVAIKIVKDKTAEAAQRLKREAEIIASIGHENICAIHGVGTTPDNRPYLVLERLTGETLQTTLHGRRRLSSESAVLVYKQVLAALDRAHSRGIVHRDLKPSNLFLVDRGGGPPVVKVLDFGLAVDMARRGARMTRPGSVSGTPQYMAPEQLIGSPVTPSADLFALSLVMYEALAGQHPFASGTLQETARRIIHERESDLAKTRPTLPFGLTAIVHAGLAKRPSDRPPSAGHMLHALDRLEDVDEEPDSSDSIDSQRALVRL